MTASASPRDRSGPEAVPSLEIVAPASGLPPLEVVRPDERPRPGDREVARHVRDLEDRLDRLGAVRLLDEVPAGREAVGEAEPEGVAIRVQRKARVEDARAGRSRRRGRRSTSGSSRAARGGSGTRRSRRRGWRGGRPRSASWSGPCLAVAVRPDPDRRPLGGRRLDDLVGELPSRPACSAPAAAAVSNWKRVSTIVASPVAVDAMPFLTVTL